jgi:hypothetical protein
MRPFVKSLIALFVFSMSIFLASCSYLHDDAQLVNQYNDLVQQHNSLLQEYNDLTEKYNDLVSQNNALLEQKSNYLAVMEQLSDEVEKYNEQLQSAKEQLESALEGAIVPPYITMNGRQATFAFRNLDNDIEYWSYDVETLEANTITGTFMRGLDISELNRLGLSSIAQRFTNKSKYVKLGGKFTCIDCRPYIVKENFQNWAPAFYSKHIDDESRIKEVWNMVTQLCPYAGELKETPRLPLETLLFGGGDCEDLAILTASILKGMSSDWTVQLVYMDSDSPSNCKTINHVSVFVDTGKCKTFVESTQKDNMSPYEIVDGFYVKVP